ncbi:hypothetical protein OIU85_028963 [Salix viminalis]|uniref:Amidohydrolase 3 domain-containing protein n=1 Tax=Salix viminalis TaxID=40686 RepID=A0A9Q0QAA8_SALVM|nr:hypothetical protein OIU85_028963 [Salix viminalis]
MISPVNSHDHHGRHTISAAYACFLDNELGSISPGKLADFVILSTSTLDDLAEGSVTVEATYVAGHCLVASLKRDEDHGAKQNVT